MKNNKKSIKFEKIVTIKEEPVNIEKENEPEKEKDPEKEPEKEQEKEPEKENIRKRAKYQTFAVKKSVAFKSPTKDKRKEKEESDKKQKENQDININKKNNNIEIKNNNIQNTEPVIKNKEIIYSKKNEQVNSTKFCPIEDFNKLKLVVEELQTKIKNLEQWKNNLQNKSIEKEEDKNIKQESACRLSVRVI